MSREAATGRDVEQVTSSRAMHLLGRGESNQKRWQRGQTVVVIQSSSPGEVRTSPSH